MGKLGVYVGSIPTLSTMFIRENTHCPCGKELTGKQKIVCSYACYQKNYRMLNYVPNPKFKKKPTKKIIPKKPCIECHNPVPRTRTVFCSDICRDINKKKVYTPL